MSSKAFGSARAVRSHLVQPGGGLSGEIYDLRQDVDGAFSLMEAAAPYVFKTGAVPTALVDADGIALAAATSAAPVTLSGATLDGALAPGSGNALIRSPKRVTLTVAGTTPAHFTGGNVTIVGEDADGAAQTEVLVASAGAGTKTGVSYFSEVTSVAFPAQGGVDATVSVGVAAEPASIADLTAATAAVVLNTDAEFNRNRVGNREMDVARAVVVVFAVHASWSGGDLTISGVDENDAAISETIAVSSGATVNGAKFFKRITGINQPAMSSAGGTATVGYRDAIIGLPKLKENGAITAVAIRELSRADDSAAWTVPTAGTVTDAATALPNGSYTPNTAPDGVRSYTLVYIAA